MFKYLRAPLNNISFLFFALIILPIAFTSIFSAKSNEGEINNKKKLEDAKKFIIGSNLGMIVMYYSNHTKDDNQEIGFENYEMYIKKGKYCQVIKVWLLNLSDKVINVNPINFKVITEKGYTLPLNDYTFRTRNPFPAVSLEPKTKIDGFIVFGLENKDNILKIIYDDGIGNRVTRDFKDALFLGFYEREVKRLKQSK